MSKIQMRQLYVALGLASLSSLSAAVDFSYSGFGNITAGRVLDATPVTNKYPDPGTWSDCPCSIVDFAHATVYEQRWAMPETRFGLQGTANINNDFSFTSQVMLRSVAKKAEASIEWAFLSYNISPSWTIQAGRKRTPLFFYSDFQDLTFAFPWIRVPPDVYGWETTNYNGVNLTYRDDIQGWAVKSNVYVGREKVKDSPFGKLEAYYLRNNPIDWEWSNMRGIDLEVNRDWLTARIAYNESQQRRVQQTPSGPVQEMPAPEFGTSSKQKFTVFSVAVDKDDFLGRLEMSKIDRSPADSKMTGYWGTLGYRFGKFLPAISATRLEVNSPGVGLVEVDSTQSFTLRYQVNDSSSIKMQYDKIKYDPTDPNRPKTVRKVIGLSYDFVF